MFDPERFGPLDIEASMSWLDAVDAADEAARQEDRANDDGAADEADWLEEADVIDADTGGAADEAAGRDSDEEDGAASVRRSQPAGKVKTVDLYPRLHHTLGGCIRLVENQALGAFDMRAECAYHCNCTWAIACSKRGAAALWAWLEVAPNRGTKRAHKDPRMLPSRAARSEARRALLALPGAEPWLAAENRHGGIAPAGDWEPERCPQ